MAKRRYTAQQVIDAIRASKGMLTIAASRLGCSADTLYNYMKRHESVARAVKRERERVTDVAEPRLYRAIRRGEAWAIQFYLKTQGKSRGYVERTELTGADGEGLHPAGIQLYWPEEQAPNPAIYLPMKDPLPPEPSNGRHDTPAALPAAPPPAAPPTPPRRTWKPI